MNKENYYTFSDAWVFMALFQYSSEEKIIDLTNIIAQGDMLNHAIFTLEELSLGFRKLQIKGLIKIEENKISLTEEAVGIREEVMGSMEGFFSMGDLTLKLLNSSQPEFKDLSFELISKCEFLSEENLTKAYNQYSK